MTSFTGSDYISVHSQHKIILNQNSGMESWNAFNNDNLVLEISLVILLILPVINIFTTNLLKEFHLKDRRSKGLLTNKMPV